MPAGAFPGTASNAKGQSESRSFDPRFGSAVSLVGPNQLTTNWQVDDFGRTVRELRADGTSSVTAYCILASLDRDISSNSAECASLGFAAGEQPAEAASMTHGEPRDVNGNKSGPFTRTYIDRAGRVIRSVTEAFDGASQAGGRNRLIVQDTEYNQYGVVTVATQPYFLDTEASVAGGAAKSYGMSTTSYDALGRPVAVYVRDAKGSQGTVQFGSRGSFQAAVTRISYTGMKVLTTDDLGQSKLEEKNVDGKLVRVTNALGAQIAYQHDAFGNLLETKDAMQNSIKLSYDIRGRKVEMRDPDTGWWQYGYNAAGEMVWQQSPNQRRIAQESQQSPEQREKLARTRMQYDVLGRMTARSEAEYESSWVYDNCPNGIGKLCASSTSNGISRKIAYDAKGRPVSTRTIVSNGPGFATATSYDSVTGRPASQTYPTGLKVDYVYTAKGFLSQLKLATAATVNPLPAVAGGVPGASVSLPAGSMLWQADSYNALGKAELQRYGNNVVSRAAFDAISGRVDTATAGLNGASTVMNYSYAWDRTGQLQVREDINGDGTTGTVNDEYKYDALGRLYEYRTAAGNIPGKERTVGIQYSALGSILYKSDVGIYTYPAQGPGALRPHAPLTVGGSQPYGYDDNGNMISSSQGNYRKISYTSFNLPDGQGGISGPNGVQYSWQYDENHQRIKETRVNSSGTRVTWMLHPDNSGGLSFESETNGSAVSNRHYLSVGGMSLGVLVSSGSMPALPAGDGGPAALGSIVLVKVEYWHKDHLDSLVATTDHAGAVTARYSYDPFGKRRTASGNYDPDGKLVYDWSNTSSGTDRGYTGHEHLDDVGLIHMNGRIFDPRLGLFLQGDPFIQDPTNLQNYNRYTYCYNNPMTCTDPSGHLFNGLIKIRALDNLWNNHIKQYAPMIASIAISVYLPGSSFLANMGVTGEFTQVAVSGFVSGAVSSGNLKGALQGAFTASMFYGVGKEFGNYKDAAGGINSSKFATAIAAHGVVGCISSVAGGGKCGSGAMSAALAKAFTPITSSFTKNDMLAGASVSAVIGGTASVLGGGKFSNGAQSAAFAYIFNQCRTYKCNPLDIGNPFDALIESPIGKLWKASEDVAIKAAAPDFYQANISVFGASMSLTKTDQSIYFTWGVELTPSLGSISVLAGYMSASSTMSVDEFLPGAAGGAVLCQRLCIGTSTAYDNNTGKTNTAYLIGGGLGSKANIGLPKTGGLLSAGATIKVHDFEK
ncbi:MULTISPECIES: RHS repeat-associated core domain-containing protein [unclassified Janthinobacterium]|uniref:RHS repeat-associated core domain-containing protein n=1 Tax=unclassified Janthinobacterium TaxID=2610881 RepID=UPI00162126C3|nr:MULTISPECIES: RHS repeat-associated core domain-containing protein [unclassified Janthinobacterium]MBB5383016.1 RHS repeat-associated protein [Janthinobacterium sp. K2Li3]MBB5388505.1 RHS repeat-associated protein [Janthinobacterium sp. K2E3]